MDAPATLVGRLKAVDSPLAFEIPASEASTSLRLVLYCEMAHESYASHWKIAQS